MMSIVKKTLATLLVSTALFSATAFANSAGDAKVRAAGEDTVSKMNAAVDLLEKGGNKDEVLKLLADVRQAQKDFRYEHTERLRQKAGNSLKAGREELEKGDAKALADLKTARDQYKEALTTYLAAH
jgi:large subunit ribosomal protein L7/L12